jgi:hypothetical protein
MLSHQTLLFVADDLRVPPCGNARGARAKKNPNPIPAGWGLLGGLLALSALQQFALNACH